MSLFSMARARSVVIWTVVYDGAGEGAAGDGTHVARYRREADAVAFAARNTCYGSPARAMEQEASIATARRWGLA